MSSRPYKSSAGTSNSRVARSGRVGRVERVALATAGVAGEVARAAIGARLGIVAFAAATLSVGATAGIYAEVQTPEPSLGDSALALSPGLGPAVWSFVDSHQEFVRKDLALKELAEQLASGTPVYVTAQERFVGGSTVAVIAERYYETAGSYYDGSPGRVGSAVYWGESENELTFCVIYRIPDDQLKAIALANLPANVSENDAKVFVEYFIYLAHKKANAGIPGIVSHHSFELDGKKIELTPAEVIAVYNFLTRASDEVPPDIRSTLEKRGLPESILLGKAVAGQAFLKQINAFLKNVFEDLQSSPEFAVTHSSLLAATNTSLFSADPEDSTFRAQVVLIADSFNRHKREGNLNLNGLEDDFRRLVRAMIIARATVRQNSLRQLSGFPLPPKVIGPATVPGLAQIAAIRGRIKTSR